VKDAVRLPAVRRTKRPVVGAEIHSRDLSDAEASSAKRWWFTPAGTRYIACSARFTPPSVSGWNLVPSSKPRNAAGHA